MTKNFDSTWEEQAGDPSTPGSGKWKIFPKSDGFYAVDDAGTVYGPFAVGNPTQGEIFLTGAGGWPSTTNGCAPNTKNEYVTNDVDIYSLDFDKDAIEYAQWTLVMPEDWDGGTVTAKFVWTCDSAGVLAVVWGLQGRSYGNDDSLDAVWGTAQEVTDVNTALGDLLISPETTAITLAGTPAGDELAQFRVYREATDVGDTLVADAKLIGVKVYYTRA